MEAKVIIKQKQTTKQNKTNQTNKQIMMIVKDNNQQHINSTSVTTVTDNGNNTSTRIYIGGLDPYKLTVDEVIQRLRQQLLLDDDDVSNNKYKIHDIFSSSQISSASYVHFTISVVNSSNNTNTINSGNELTPTTQSSSSGGKQQQQQQLLLSPFDKVSKLFHNVKWKGCKLKVELAKPHFLQRLREEIQQRTTTTNSNEQLDNDVNDETTTIKNRDHHDEHRNDKSRITTTTVTSAIATSTTACSGTEKKIKTDSESIQQLIPRHLRIKKGYGEERVKVDTKPCLVTDWKSFDLISKQMKVKRESYQKLMNKHNTNNKQQQQQQQKQQSSNKLLYDSKQNTNSDTDQQKKAYFNRAIHLRFVDDSTNSNNVNNTSIINNNNSINDGSDNDDDSDMSHEILVDDHNESIENWGNENQLLLSRKTLSSETNSILSHDDESLDDEVCIIRSDTIINQTESSCSSNEDDDTYNDQNNSIKQITGTISTTIVIDDGDGDGDDINEEEIDLNKDVEKNLSILSQMFPELMMEGRIKIQPKNHSNDQQQTAVTNDLNSNSRNNNNDNSNPDTKQNQTGKNLQHPGWTESGQMVRYDPRKVTSKVPDVKQDLTTKDIVIDDSSTTYQDTSSPEIDVVSVSNLETMKLSKPSQPSSSPVATIDDDIPIPPVSIDNNDDNNTNPLQHIYDQTRLEDVFREAREGTNRPLLFNTAFAATSNNTVTTTFGFSFFGQQSAQDLLSTSSSTSKISESKEAVIDLIVDDKDDGIKNDDTEVESIPQQSASTRLSNRKRARYYDFFNVNSNNSTTIVKKGRLSTGVLTNIIQSTFSDSLPCNEGYRILNDLETYRSDPTTITSWKNEQKRLTSGWKQKIKNHHQQQQSFKSSYVGKKG